MRYKDILIRAYKNILNNKARNLLLLISISLSITSLIIMLSIGYALEKEFKAQYSTKNDPLNISLFVKGANDLNKIKELLDNNKSKVIHFKYYNRLYSDKDVKINNKISSLSIYSSEGMDKPEINKKYYKQFGFSPLTISSEDGTETISPVNLNEKLEGNLPVIIIPHSTAKGLSLLKVRDIILQIKCSDEPAGESILASLKSLGYNPGGGAGGYKKLSDIFKIVRYILTGIGAIAILISLITISNTLAASVEERLKEIEIMKILGGSEKSLSGIFVGEFIILGAASSVLGIILSLSISMILNYLYLSLNISELFNIYKISLVDFKALSLGMLISLTLIISTVFFMINNLMKKSYLQVLKEE
ncbi:ABC transporter permease [Clostridium polynesiense]|uniref:ABC transporter permease n=1 Tax=Clostridium polynesiense TaxID=1325933 RepID=UPI000590C16F|nr:FtsX-like permease family protein [Clostridium polynesiense]